jgi:hypothetical protein
MAAVAANSSKLSVVVNSSSLQNLIAAPLIQGQFIDVISIQVLSEDPAMSGTFYDTGGNGQTNVIWQVGSPVSDPQSYSSQIFRAGPSTPPVGINFLPGASTGSGTPLTINMLFICRGPMW